MNVVFLLILGLINFSVPFRSSDGRHISQIQGTGHRSAFAGTQVRDVSGVVTALYKANRNPGFWMQDPDGDRDPATSDGIFVTYSLLNSIALGTLVSVGGSVEEMGFSGALTRTQIRATEVRALSRGNPLPEPVLIGVGGRVQPGEIIDDDGLTRFEPETDGIDFYESLEGMRVRINDAVVVAPTSRFGEIAVLPDNGTKATVKSRRGGIVVRESDFNPEIIILDDLLVDDAPQVTVGDKFSAPISGVIDYSFGNFKLLNPEPLPALIAGELQPELTQLVPGPDFLTVASFNVENLHFKDKQNKYDAVAGIIATNLAAPDIVALQEVQDNSGPEDDGLVDADSTLQRLVRTIAAINGVAYQFCQLNPVDKIDGGQPGGNIRVAFLFNPDRVTFNPGDGLQRVGVVDSAFVACRKSLSAEFGFNGHKLILINNHLSSKRGDDALFGARQPPQLKTEPKRSKQAGLINGFVKSALQQAPQSNIIVLGDMNEYEFRQPVRILAGTELTDMLFEIPQADRYTYIFNGNSQVLDHILISSNLRKAAKPEIDIVHVNAEFPSRARSSDHDPVLARFSLPK